MADIQGLSVGVSLDSVEMERGLKGLKDRLRTVNSEMKSNMSAFDRSDQSIGKYETRLEGLNKKLETQKRVTQASKDEYEKMVREHGEGSKEAERAERAYNNQAASLNNLERYVANATEELQEMKRQQEIANSGWTKTGKKLQETGNRMSEAGDNVQRFGRKWTKVTSVIAGAVAGAGVAIFGLTKKVAENADEVATQSAEMGVSTDFYQEMDYWANQNGISQEQMQKAIGRLNQRIGQAKDGNEKYSDALEAVGISMEDVKNGNISTEDAFAKSIQTLSGMENEQEKVSKATELFGTRMARQLLPALQDGSMSMDEARKKAQELGLVMSGEQIEAAQKFQAQYDTIKMSLAAVGREIGLELMPYMQQMMDWVMGNMPQIKDTITGAFQTAIESIKNVVNWFRNLDPAIQKSIGAFAGVTAAIGPVSIALGGLMKVFGPVVTVIGKASVGIGKLGGALPALKAGFAALTGPVGLTVTAIGGLTAAFVTAYTKSETFRNIVHTAFNAIKEIITSVVNSVVGFVQQMGNKLQEFWQENGNQIKQAMQNIWNVVQPIIQKIYGLFKKVFPLILEIVKSVWDNIKGVISGTLDVIMGLVKTFSSLLTGDFKGMWEGIKQIFSGAIEFIWNFIQLQLFGRIMKAVKPFASGLKKIFKTLWEGIKKIFKTTITSIYNFFKNRFTALKNTGETIFNALKTFFSTIWKGIKTIFTTVIKSIFNFVKKWFTKTKNNISTIFNAVKSFFSKIWSGIKKIFTTVIKSIVDFIKTWFTNAKNNIKSIFNAVKKFFKTIWDGIKGIFTSVIKSIVNFVKKRFNVMKSNITSIWNGIKKITKSAWNGVKKFIIDPVKSGVKWALDKFGSFKKKVSDIFGNIKDGIGDKVGTMIQFVKDMPGKMKKAVKDGAGAVKNGFLTIARKIVDGIAAGVNGLRKGVKWALDKIGMGDKVWSKWDPESSLNWYAQGTKGHPNNSPAVVGDGKGSNSGSELITRPNGQSYLSPDKPTLTPMEKGTQVTPAKITKQLMNSAPHYALGTDIWKGIKTGGKKAWDGTKTAGKKAWGGVKKGGESLWKGAEFIGGKAKEGAKYLLNKGLKKMGVKIPEGVKAMGHFYKGTFDKLKGWSLDYIKDKLSDFNEKYITGMDGDLFGKNFTMTSDYGNRKDPMGGGTTFHEGVDFAADVGTPISAIKGGKVIHAGEGGRGSGYNGYGKSVVLRSGDYDYLYGHMSKVYSRKGDDIKKGGALGEVGQTGQATGPHVHFEVRKKGTMQTVDPNKLFGEPEPDASGKGVKRWKGTVKKALAKNGLSTSGAMVNKVLRQISTESSGNPKAVQGSDVWDVNMAKGTPARGLMQTIPSTFAAYKHKGHGNIMNGYDNLLAALAYAKSRYGKNLSALGKGHGYEKGTNYVPENQWAYLHKGEAVVPKEHNNPMPTDAMKLLALVGKQIKEGKSNRHSGSTGNKEIVDKLNQMMELLANNAGQTINFNQEGATRPSDAARKLKQVQRQMAMGL